MNPNLHKDNLTQLTADCNYIMIRKVHTYSSALSLLCRTCCRMAVKDFWLTGFREILLRRPAALEPIIFGPSEI